MEADFYSWGFPLFLLIVSYTAFPYSHINQNEGVEHEAAWLYVGPYDENLAMTERSREKCDIQLVLFVLDEYDHQDVVCDQSLVDYLETVQPDRVRMTYRVTYDFDDPRSYQLTSIGPVPITWDAWVASWGGCGGLYSHPCNNPQAQSGSHLVESTWVGE